MQPDSVGIVKRPQQLASRSSLALGLAVFIFCAASAPVQAGIIDFINEVKVGAPMPDVDLQYLSAKPNTQGKVLLIDFWATWCAPCRAAMPHLSALQERFADQGLVVIGVSKESRDTVIPVLPKLNMRYAYAVEGERSLHKTFKVTALPYSMVVDRAGKIIWRGQPTELTDVQINEWLAKPLGSEKTAGLLQH